ERAVKVRSQMPINRNKLLAVPVPARDERQHEYNRATEWQKFFADAFASLYQDWLPKTVSPADAVTRLFIPYVGEWSFGERLPVLEGEREGVDPGSIGAAYTRLATLLANRLEWNAIARQGSKADLAAAQL